MSKQILIIILLLVLFVSSLVLTWMLCSGLKSLALLNWLDDCLNRAEEQHLEFLKSKVETTPEGTLWVSKEAWEEAEELKTKEMKKCEETFDLLMKILKFSNPVKS